MPGIRIAHKTAKNGVVLVPIMSKPFAGQSIDRCPSCYLVHPVKTVHLWLDAAGSCIVSAGVLADLQSAGMPDLTVTGTVENPPPLQFGPGVTREQIDNNNRRVVRHSPFHV
ncbi:MAG: hypothetical protein M3N43_03260 [Actinomycetota bacterium]|nr:hypothetical protein [Actinomycetota bacterium]